MLENFNGKKLKRRHDSLNTVPYCITAFLLYNKIDTPIDLNENNGTEFIKRNQKKGGGS